jgi:hypothetical protein
VVDLPGRLGPLFLAGVLGLLTACGASDPPATANEGPGLAASAPSVATSPAPARPAAVTYAARRGAEAAAQYWFDALSYAQQSGDLRPVQGASTKDCKACADIIDSIRATFAGGGSVFGGGYTVREMTSEEYSAVVPLLNVVFDREALSIVGTGGATMQSVPALSFQTARVRLLYSKRWRVAEVTGIGPLGG